MTRLYEPISPRLKHDKFTVRMKKEFLSNRNVVSQDFGEGEVDLNICEEETK